MIWILVVFFPLFPATLLAVSSIRADVSRHGLWAAPLPALVLALAGNGVEPVFLPSLFLGTTLHFGSHGQIFLLLTALVWTAAGLFACASSTRNDPGQTRFAVFFLMTLCGNLGLSVAQDLASLYVFFAMMSFSAYGLIVHKQTAAALRAARVYLIMAVIGEVLLAAAFFYAGQTGLAGQNLLFSDISAHLAGHRHETLILGLAFVGFGIKAGVIGLHFWLPLAHPAAPTAASAVLSGVMIKAGLLGWLQLFPLGAGLHSWGMTLAWLGLAAALYGVVSGLVQDDPKTILAYSSVSQMGLMTMGLGCLLWSGPGAEALLPGLLFFVLVHGLAKGSLFLGVGVAKDTGRNSFGGLLILAGLALSALVLAGLPLTGGFAVKQFLKEAAGGLPAPWSSFFTFMLSVTATGTMLLLTVFVRRVHGSMPAGRKSASPGTIAAWSGLLVLLLSAAVLMGTVSSAGLTVIPSHWKYVAQAIWPIALGVGGAVLVLLRTKDAANSAKDSLVPDAMILGGLERGLARLQQWWRRTPLHDPAWGAINLVALSDRLFQSRWMRTVPDILEQRLLYWHTVGVLFVFLLLAFLTLAWWGVQ